MSKKPPPRRRSPGKPEAPDREQRGVLIRVNADGLKSLRLLAIELDTTLQALGIDALNDLLVKNGRKPIVKNPLLD